MYLQNIPQSTHIEVVNERDSQWSSLIFFDMSQEAKETVSCDTGELNIHLGVKISHKKLSAHGKVVQFKHVVNIHMQEVGCNKR